jgi:hypothetical protein
MLEILESGFTMTVASVRWGFSRASFPEEAFPRRHPVTISLQRLQDRSMGDE